jgi:hypothetical protein
MFWMGALLFIMRSVTFINKAILKGSVKVLQHLTGQLQILIEEVSLQTDIVKIKEALEEEE